MTAPKTTLSAATRRTVRVLRRSGAVKDVDALAVANVLFTADQLDHLDPGTSLVQVASLVRAHLAATKLLLGRDDADNDGWSEVMAALATPLGYADDQPWSPMT